MITRNSLNNLILACKSVSMTLKPKFCSLRYSFISLSMSGATTRSVDLINKTTNLSFPVNILQRIFFNCVYENTLEQEYTLMTLTEMKTRKSYDWLEDIQCEVILWDFKRFHAIENPFHAILNDLEVLLWDFTLLQSDILSYLEWFLWGIHPEMKENKVFRIFFHIGFCHSSTHFQTRFSRDNVFQTSIQNISKITEPIDFKIYCGIICIII